MRILTWVLVAVSTIGGVGAAVAAKAKKADARVSGSQMNRIKQAVADHINAHPDLPYTVGPHQVALGRSPMVAAPGPGQKSVRQSLGFHVVLKGMPKPVQQKPWVAYPYLTDHPATALQGTIEVVARPVNQKPQATYPKGYNGPRGRDDDRPPYRLSEPYAVQLTIRSAVVDPTPRAVLLDGNGGNFAATLRKD